MVVNASSVRVHLPKNMNESLLEKASLTIVPEQKDFQISPFYEMPIYKEDKLRSNNTHIISI